jgi:hypothetical protein
MRPINIKPASVVGGSGTAFSASRISFSRTILPDPSDARYWVGGAETAAATWLVAINMACERPQRHGVQHIPLGRDRGRN